MTTETTVNPSSVVEFKDVIGETYTVVGTDGSIWTRWKRLGRGYRRETRYVDDEWELLKTIDCDGYAIAYLPSGRKVNVSWVVLEAFVGMRPPGMNVLHRNDVRSDNSLSNLYYGTDRDNAHDRDKNGRGGRNKGDRNGSSQLTRDEVQEVRRLRDSGMSYREIQEVFPHVTTGTLRNVVNRKTYADVN